MTVLGGCSLRRSEIAGKRHGATSPGQRRPKGGRVGNLELPGKPCAARFERAPQGFPPVLIEPSRGRRSVLRGPRGCCMIPRVRGPEKVPKRALPPSRRRPTMPGPFARITSEPEHPDWQ